MRDTMNSTEWYQAKAELIYEKRFKQLNKVSTPNLSSLRVILMEGIALQTQNAERGLCKEIELVPWSTAITHGGCSETITPFAQKSPRVGIGHVRVLVVWGMWGMWSMWPDFASILTT